MREFPTIIHGVGWNCSRQSSAQDRQCLQIVDAINCAIRHPLSTKLPVKKRIQRAAVVINVHELVETSRNVSKLSPNT